MSMEEDVNDVCTSMDGYGGKGQVVCVLSRGVPGDGFNHNVIDE